MLDIFDSSVVSVKTTQFLLGASIFILFSGFIYGYAVSFLFGIKKTLKISLLIEVLISTLFLFICAGYVFYTSCSENNTLNNCSDFSYFFLKVPSIITLLLFHLFFNILSGYIGVIVGICLYFPSGWFLNNYFAMSNLKTSTEEYEKINNGINNITTATSIPPDIKDI